MTDKQIIIDGVDVRKCVNRRWDNSQKIHLCYDSDTPLTSWGWCENNSNCYYKQLKRKEQECEELKAKLLNLLGKEGLRQSEKEFYEQQLDQLKEQLEAYKMEAEEGKEINKELEAENERLKKEIRLYDCINKWGTEQCHCACRCLGNEFCDAAEEKMKNIKKTLADIKELLVKTPTDSPMHCVNAKSVILQKISECEGNNG